MEVLSAKAVSIKWCVAPSIIDLIVIRWYNTDIQEEGPLLRFDRRGKSRQALYQGWSVSSN